MNKNSCKEIASNCWATGKRNIEQVYPYLKAVENLSRCTFEGKKNSFEELVFVSSGTVIKQMPDTSDKVDGDLCAHMVSLGSETNVNTEGDADFLKKLYNRTKG